jgi:hypothetical protein
MPILTKNETPAKGQKAEFELDKSALAAIVSDLYFQDSANWKSVEMIFKSNPGKQRRVVKFDASQATPLASFFTSIKARDVFQIEKIVINDFDNGSFTVLRSELTVAEFDIDMGGPAPVVSLDFTQGALPAGSSVVSGTAPIMNNASAKFDGYGAQINMPVAFSYVSSTQYKVRLYVKAAAEAPGASVTAQLNSLFRTSSSPIMEVPPFVYGSYDAELDLSAKVGSYVEYTFTSGNQFNDGWPVILVVQISPSGSVGSSLEITKIEIFEV